MFKETTSNQILKHMSDFGLFQALQQMVFLEMNSLTRSFYNFNNLLGHSLEF